jgi:hypothetical protein
MNRYQIRLPENMILQDLVADMTVNAWLMVHRYFIFFHPIDEAHLNFQNCIISNLTKRIKTFDMCGAVSVCNQAETRPLRGQSEFEVQPGDTIYHLIMEEDLDEFLNHLALEGTDSLKEILQPESEMEVFKILQMVFRFALEDYLYFNPECGSAKVCEGSEEINAWGSISRKLLN